MRPGPDSHWRWVRCAGVVARLSLAPSPVPRFVVCCARFLGSRHPVAVVAWHLSSCRGCGRGRASLACLVAPRWRAAPRPVRSLSVPQSAFPSPWCLPPPQGLSPPALLGGCAGHVEAGQEPGPLCLPLAPAEARALGALRVVPVQGPHDGVVPGGSLRLRSWAACAAVGWRVCTRSLTRPVSRTVRLSTGDSAGAPGLFRVDADTSPFGSGDATPGSRASVCACPSWLGRAGRPPGRVLVRLTFSCGRLVLLLCSAPTGLGFPALWVFFFIVFLLFFLFLSPFVPPAPDAPAVSGLLCFPAAGALGLGALCFCSILPPPRPVFFCFFSGCVPLPSPSPRYFLLLPCGASGLAPPLFRPPPPFFFLCCLFPVVFSLFCAPSSRLPCLGVSVVSGPGCPGPWRSVSCLSLLLLFFSVSPLLFCPPVFLVPGALGALGLWSAWLGSFFLLRVRPCVCCVRRVPGLPFASFLAGAALLLRSRWPVPCVVACGCGVVAAGSGLPSVVFRWRALAWEVLPGRVARRPAVCFGSLWRPAPLCCVLCSVALYCRVAACCAALLSVLLCSLVGVALCCSLAPSVLRCAFLWVVFCVPVVCPRLFFAGSGCLLAVLFRLRWLVLCVVAFGCRLFVAGSGCLLLFSSGVCCLGCSCLAAWLAALLCAVVRCGAVFPRALSRVLWCCVALRCRAVARCCPALFAARVVLSFPGVCGAVLRCASCCSVLVWSALSLVPRTVVCRGVMWCLPWRSVVWWCCSGASWRLAVPCCVLWCCVALWCRAAGLRCAFCFAAGVRFSSKNHFAVFENKNKIK